MSREPAKLAQASVCFVKKMPFKKYQDCRLADADPKKSKHDHFNVQDAQIGTPLHLNLDFGFKKNLNFKLYPF